MSHRAAPHRTGLDRRRTPADSWQRDVSMLTWENTPIQGTAAIMEKLQVGGAVWGERERTLI